METRAETNSIPGVTPSELYSHADSIRKLVRGVLADDHATEDVLQDTYVMALEHPPHSLAETNENRSSLGGWLRTVAKSIALKRVRGASRRSRREREHASSERIDGPEVILSDAERAKRLSEITERVLTLPEPYRGTVLQRYFENLPPREIARRSGVPLATVKSRLQRALARLRTDFEGQSGSHWRRDLALLVGLRWPATPLPVAPEPATARPLTGGPLTSGKPMLLTSAKVLSLAAGSLVLATFAPGWLQQEAKAPSSAVVPTPALSSPTRQDPPAVAALDRDIASTRVAAAAPAPEPTPKSSAAVVPSLTPVQLSVEVVDTFGLPAVATTVYAAPAGYPLHRLGPCDATGRFPFSFLWNFGEERDMEIVFGVGHANDVPRDLQLLRLRKGIPNKVKIAIASLGAGNLSFEERTGTSWHFNAPSVFATPHREEGGHLLFSRTTTNEPQSRLTGNFVVRTEFKDSFEGEEGEYLLAEIVTAAHYTDFDSKRTGPYGGYVERQLYTGELGTNTFELVELAADEGPHAGTKVQVNLTDADGSPGERVRIAALTDDGRLLQSAWTDEQGHAELAGLPAGAVEIVAAGGVRGEDRQTFELGPDVEATWNTQLVPTPLLGGTVRHAEQSLRTKYTGEWFRWQVEARHEGPDGVLIARTPVLSDGSFVFSNLESVPYELSILSYESLGVRGRGQGQPGDPAVSLLVDSGSNDDTTVRIALRNEDGQSLPSVIVRLFDLDAHHGHWIGRPDQDEGHDWDHHRTKLHAGRYRVEIGATGYLWQELPNVLIGPGTHELDLGQVNLVPLNPVDSNDEIGEADTAAPVDLER